MAAGVVQDGIINSIYHLVKHIFNVQNRGEHILLEAEREMLFSIILKMIENAKVFPLFNFGQSEGRIENFRFSNLDQ